MVTYKPYEPMYMENICLSQNIDSHNIKSDVNL